MEKGKLSFCIKVVATNQWDAPESNNTIALLQLTWIISIIMVGASWASSIATWFRQA
jgi:hypothetical protein